MPGLGPQWFLWQVVQTGCTPHMRVTSLPDVYRGGRGGEGGQWTIQKLELASAFLCQTATPRLYQPEKHIEVESAYPETSRHHMNGVGCMSKCKW